MKCRGAALLTGLLLVGGCVGHLEFDPRTDPGSEPKPNNDSGGSGGRLVQSGSSDAGSGGQVMAPGTGGSPGTGGTTTSDAGVVGSGGAAPAPGTGGAPADYGDAGTSSDGTVAAVVCPTGYNIATALFTPKCAGCHSATSPTKNLDLATAGIAARMLNKVSTCMNQPLIAGTLIGNAPTGLLFKKLQGNVDGCGVQMPAGAAPLTAVEMACVNDWAVAAINKAAGK
jgi:hypothetical protein